MVSDNSFYQKHAIALSFPNKNLKCTIDVFFADVQAKGIALAAFNYQLITCLPFVFFNQGVYILQRTTKAINFLLIQDVVKSLVTCTS